VHCATLNNFKCHNFQRTGTGNMKLVVLESRHCIAKALYSCHQCLEFSEVSKKDILINYLIDDLILIQETLVKA